MSAPERATAIPDRLPFRLPDFTRSAWVSDQARECWEPRIRRIIRMLLELEWRAMVTGIRRCALRSIPADQLDEVRRELGRRDIEVELLQGTAARLSYSTSLEPCTSAKPALYWCALGKGEDLKDIVGAYHANDQSMIGELLGYPRCCNDFFQRTWVQARLADTTWSMSVGSPSATFPDRQSVEIHVPSLCGVHLRWLGVRAVFHLPCSYECTESLRLADLHLRLGRKLGFELECGWLEEMLSWPAEWSALHGIAEIRTPVVKVVTLTDATPGKLRVRYQGVPSLCPEHAGTGLVFPFRRKLALPLLLSRGFQLGLANPIAMGREGEPYVYAPWYPRDNGFATRYVMDRSQAPLVERVKELLAEQPVQGDRAPVREFGCRNGALLRKICTLSPVLTPRGIDRDPEKIAHALLLHPNAPPGAFTVADPFGAPNRDLDGDAYLTILMLGRLVEIPVAVARAVCDNVYRSTRYFLVYAYDDYVRKVGSLSEMAEQIGLDLRDITKTATVELAWAAGRQRTRSPDRPND